MRKDYNIDALCRLYFKSKRILEREKSVTATRV